MPGSTFRTNPVSLHDLLKNCDEGKLQLAPVAAVIVAEFLSELDVDEEEAELTVPAE